ILAELVDVLLEPALSNLERFRDVVKRIAECGQRANLASCFANEQAVRLLIEAWRERIPAGIARAPPRLHDPPCALQLLEHAVRPLCHPPVSADILHASTNGLGVLPGLIAKWRYGTPMVVSEHGVYLREQCLHSRTGPYRWPVKSLYLTFVRHVGAL